MLRQLLSFADKFDISLDYLSACLVTMFHKVDSGTVVLSSCRCSENLLEVSVSSSQCQVSILSIEVPCAAPKFVRDNSVRSRSTNLD